MPTNRATRRHGLSSRSRRAAAADTNMYDDDDDSQVPIYQCVLETTNARCQDCRRYLGRTVFRTLCDGCKYNGSNWYCNTRSLRQDSFVSAWSCYYCVSDALQILMRS